MPSVIQRWRFPDDGPFRNVNTQRKKKLRKSAFEIRFKMSANIVRWKIIIIQTNQASRAKQTIEILAKTKQWRNKIQLAGIQFIG